MSDEAARLAAMIRANGQPICGAPCPYGGMWTARKFSSAELGWMGHCNRRVRSDGDHCSQHSAGASPSADPAGGTPNG